MRETLQVRCRKIQKEDLGLIMEWRMRPDITKYMNTDPVLTMEGQLKWFEKIQTDADNFYWVVEVDGAAAGIASLVDRDQQAGRIHTGVYIAVKEKRSLQLIVELQWNLYEYAFEKLGMHKVCEEVFAENKGVLRILDLCGSKKEGVLREHIFKNGTYYDVVVRGILREEWGMQKEKIAFGRFDFED